MYGIGGEAKLDEHELDHLSGYENSKPVRIGNAAYKQNQHDVWGAVLDSVYIHAKSRDYLPDQLWPMLERQVEAALENWRKPDAGIWEVRGKPRHFTSSKLMCWVAVDRGARLARLRDEEETAKRWETAAAEIHADICKNAVDERGVFTQHYETEALDASNLLMPMLRFLPPDDERIRKTVLAIADELTDHGFVLRYRTEETDDGLSGVEGTFLICSFWLVSALVEIGEIQRGRELCEKLLAHSSDLFLYAEELEPQTGRHLGNFPQAFTHLALINAVVHVIRRGGAGGSLQVRPCALSQLQRVSFQGPGAWSSTWFMSHTISVASTRVTKPWTSKPPAISEVSSIISSETKNHAIPTVITASGRLSSFSTGFTRLLSTPKIAAAISRSPAF